MTALLIVLVVLLATALVALAATHLQYRRRRPKRAPAAGAGRILFPFMAGALSQRALDAALRLARAEDATLVPVFLARVSLHLPIDTPLPRQSGLALSLQEVIEQRASTWGIPVDARIERGRTYRHALRQTFEHETYDRIVLAAGARGNDGFDAGDVAWLLDNAAGEIVVLRPASGTTIGLPVLRSLQALPLPLEREPVSY
ncbi:MAG TPA: universal stress protein [Solirubrobacteraceae bacterium]|nr:universal stress protein [Solirubrobacteraceae bacterium]